MSREAPYVTGRIADPGPSGLGGWLVLPIIGLILSALAVVGRALTDTIPTFRDGTWAILTTPGSEAYHPAWAPLLLFEYLTDAIVLVCAIVLLVFLFQKRPILPRLMVGFWSFSFLIVLIDSLVVLEFAPELLPDAAVREEIGWTTARLMGDVARVGLGCAIWIPYFLMSRRVKNTFATPAPPAPAWTFSSDPHS